MSGTLFVLNKMHEAPCVRCAKVGKHLCGDPDDDRVACADDVLQAFLAERYRDEGRHFEHDRIAGHVADCSRCGPWVKKRHERSRWVAGSGLLTAKIVRFTAVPRAAWPSDGSEIPAELRGRTATVVTVLRPYQERVEVRLHRAAKGTPRTTVVVPLTWLEATEHQPSEP